MNSGGRRTGAGAEEGADVRADGAGGPAPARRSGIGRQFSGVLASRVSGAVLQAAVGIALARSVVPDEYGVIVAFTGLVVFLLVVADLGVSSYIGQARARGAHDEVSAALVVNTVSSVSVGVLCGAGAVLVWAQRPELALALLLVALGQALEKNVECMMSVFIADGRIRLPAVSILLRRVGLAVVFVAAVALGVDAVPAYGVAVLLGALAGRVHVGFGARRMHLDRSRGIGGVPAVLRSSFPFAVNDASIQSRGLDVAVVTGVVGAFTGGLYAAAAKIMAPFNLVASTLAAVVLPHATRSTGARTRRLVDVLVLASLVATGLAVVPAVFAEEILRLVVGEDYTTAAGCLAVLLVSLPLTVVATPIDAVLQGRGRSATVARISVLSSVVLLASTGLGAFLDGATGAAVGFACVSVIKTFVLYAVARSRNATARS